MNVDAVRPVAVLAIIQVVAWGVVSLPPVIGAQMGASLGLDLPTVLTGSSLVMVVSGLASPPLGRAYARFGARPVMMAGTLVGAAGLLLLSGAQGVAGYVLAWTVLGLYGAAVLTTSAYVYLNECLGTRARGAIGVLMLATGLATGLFWPLTAALTAQIGWRGTVILYSGLLVGLVLPLLAWGLPGKRTAAEPAHATSAKGPGLGTPFWLMVAAIGLSGFVTFGFEAIAITLFRAFGYHEGEAIAVASALSFLKVGGRLLDLAGGERWDGLTTAVAAASVMPVGIGILLAGQGATVSVWLFTGLFGLASGAFAIARATMPLVFYDKAAYGAALARLALPLNLAYAASPPVLAAALAEAGPRGSIGIALACSFAALLVLLVLGRLRPAHHAAAAVASRTMDRHHSVR